MADHPLHILPFSYDLKFRAEHHPTTKAILKIQCLLHAFISRHASRIAAALRGASSMLLDLLSKKIKRRKNKSMGRRSCNNDSPATMHLSLLSPDAMPSSCSSSEMAVLRLLDAGSSYDPSWSTVTSSELQLLPVTGYLEWFGEDDQTEDDDIEVEDAGCNCNEIDMLAERFIARCHERFVLEKQESYRRYQEMLARSL